MKMMCISNTSYLITVGKGPLSRSLKLTVGKVYEATIDQHNNYSLRNDLGAFNIYPKKLFIPLDEWRYEKLKEIGI